MSTERDGVPDRIATELNTAEHARKTGNQGMVRVCARRAAGLAIGHWMAQNRRPGRSSDAMNRIRAVERDESMPADVRDAAGRLAAKMTTPYPGDALLDANTIIRHFLP